MYFSDIEATDGLLPSSPWWWWWWWFEHGIWDLVWRTLAIEISLWDLIQSLIFAIKIFTQTLVLEIWNGDLIADLPNTDPWMVTHWTSTLTWSKHIVVKEQFTNSCIIYMYFFWSLSHYPRMVARATGNSRFENAKFPPPKKKFPKIPVR